MSKSDTRDPAERLREQLKRVSADFEGYRQRTSAEQKKARERGRDEAAEALLDIVDDCDRALSLISDAAASPAQAGAANDQVTSGVEQLLARALRHFAKLGYESVGAAGEGFDPHIHEAVSVEAGSGPDGSILRVHRRGWERADGGLVRPAMVTVLQGTSGPPEDPPPRRRHRPSPPDAYVCPYGIAGCKQDCPGCAPPPPELFTENDDPFASSVEVEF